MENIRLQLATKFPSMQSPSADVVYDTLAQLSQQGHLYQTSRGYFIVTPEWVHFLIIAWFWSDFSLILSFFSGLHPQGVLGHYLKLWRERRWIYILYGRFHLDLELHRHTRESSLLIFMIVAWFRFDVGLILSWFWTSSSHHSKFIGYWFSWLWLDFDLILSCFWSDLT